ncbi:uncharacterized protein LOC144476612 [Augochlora pura]
MAQSTVKQTPLALNAIEEIALLEQQFSRITGCITRLRKEGRASYTCPLLKDRLEHVTSIWVDALAGYNKLKRALPTSRREELEFFAPDRFDELEEMYLDARGYICTEISKLEGEQSGSERGNSDTSVVKTDGNQTIPIELPRQQLPTFTGNPCEWVLFENLFTSIIAEHKGLTDVQRLRYLHMCLEAEARTAISHLPIVMNFSIAWKALKDTFGLECLVVADLLRQIIKLKPIRDGDLASIQQVTIQTKQALATLDALGFCQDYALTVQFIVDKFDRKLKREWGRSRINPRKFPSLKELMEFLDKEAISLLMINATSDDRVTRKPSTRVNVHNVAVEPTLENKLTCMLCTKSHALYECPIFLRWRPDQRYKVVKDRGGCTRCLNATHTYHECKTQIQCDRCRGAHHTLLHRSFQDSRSPSRPEPVPAESRRTGTKKKSPSGSQSGKSSAPEKVPVKKGGKRPQS